MRKKSLSQAKFFIAALLFLAGFLAAGRPAAAQAAEQPVSVTSCKLGSSGKKLTVKAKVKTKTKAMGKKLYLLGLNANVSETGKKSASPVASVKAKKGTVTFKAGYKNAMLFQKFVVAYKSGKKYKIVSDARYITNPQVLASYKGSGPKAASKKGIQAEHVEDSLELGTQHVVLNWTLNSLLNQGAINKTSFQYKGKTYYLDADQILRNDEMVRTYNAAGVRVTVILLLPKDKASKGTSSMQYGGYNYTLYSSVKTSNKASCQTFEAIMSYLAKRYGTQENLVSGWILGNEVNSACIWNYGGDKSLSAYMENYARAFRICHNAVKSVSKNSNVYISLDYNWNTDSDGSGKRYFSSKAVLDEFYKKIKEKGKIDFRIAYHAYPEGMSDPVFWDDAKATNSVNAKIINFKNLKTLTNYVKKKIGTDCKIMLSEQSFNSTKGEAVQAAAYAYAYYMCEGNGMIEAFIYGRHIDHPSEMSLGYHWGLYNDWYVKRLIWHVFQYIDSKESFSFTDPLLQYTNLKKWNKISGFKKAKYTGMPSRLKQASITNIESVSATSVKLTWEKISSADGYEIYRNGVLAGSVSGNSIVTYTDRELAKAGTYQYQVRMYKEAPKSGDPTKKVKLYGGMSAAFPITVTAAQAVWNKENCGVSGSRITLAWKKMTDVDGFEISRSTEENGTYTPIFCAAGSANSYTDETAVPGTVYYYKLRAYVTVNGGSYFGSYSESIAEQANIQLTVGIRDGKVVMDWTGWPNAYRYRIFYKKLADTEYIRKKNIEGTTYSMEQYKDAAGVLSDFVIGETYCFRVRAVYSDGTLSDFSNVFELTIDDSIHNPLPQQEIPAEAGETEPQETEPPGTETETEPEETKPAPDEAKEPEETEPGMTEQAPSDESM